MMSIEISEDTEDKLSKLAQNNKSYDEIINFLIKYYMDNEEFTDEEAEFYNKENRKI